VIEKKSFEQKNLTFCADKVNINAALFLGVDKYEKMIIVSAGINGINKERFLGMPIYEYQCAKCHEVIEELQKFSDPPLKKCPACGGKVHKLMSLNTFHLKGTGWYATDYSNKKSPPATPKASETDSTTKDDSSKTKETKTED